MFEDTIGVDISKDHLDVHRLSDGAVARFGNDRAGFAAFRRWLGQGPRTSGAPSIALRVVYEPTGACHGAFERCFAGQLALCKVNPLMARRFAQSTGTRAKTDAVDARLLAVMGAALALEPDPPLSQDIRDLKELQAERRALVRDRTRLLTRLKTLTLRFALSQARARLSLILRQLKELTARIMALITQQRATARAHAILCSIPGLGPVSAAAILIEMPEIGTLEGKRCASLAGLAPMTQASGRWRGQAHVQGGRKPLRDALYMPALVATRHNAPLKARYQSLRARGKPAKLALAAVMRALIETANALVKKDRFWTPLPA
jgi:transposase